MRFVFAISKSHTRRKKAGATLLQLIIQKGA